MARPSAQVIKTAVTSTGTQLEILEAEDCYVIVYKKKPVNIRHTTQGLGPQRKKYMKLSFTNEGNAIAQVRRLNKLFDCEDFAFIRSDV